MPPAISTYVDPRSASLNAHIIRQIDDNIKMKVDEGKNLVTCVDADLSDDATGVAFTSNDAQDIEMKVLTRADRYTDQNNEILKVGQRQANYFEPFLSVEHSSSEKFERAVDPADSLNSQFGRAHNLYQDQVIMGNLFADMLEAEDEDPETAKLGILHKMKTVAFPASMIVPVNYAGYHHGKASGKEAPAAADQGLTKGKILKGRELLANHVRDGRIILALSEIDVLNLATDLELTSVDHVNQKLLTEINRIISNEIDMALGVTFKVLRPKAIDGYGTASAKLGMYRENAIEYREREIIPFDIKQLPERHYNWQAYKRLRMGCLRNSDADVVQILVKQD